MLFLWSAPAYTIGCGFSNAFGDVKSDQKSSKTFKNDQRRSKTFNFVQSNLMDQRRYGSPPSAATSI
jgi:hypothetical protein